MGITRPGACNPATRAIASRDRTHQKGGRYASAPPPQPFARKLVEHTPRALGRSYRPPSNCIARPRSRESRVSVCRGIKQAMKAGMTMTSCMALSVAVAVTAAATISDARRAAADDATLTPLPRDLEVKLALSSVPPHLRADATIFVLDPTKGYVVERQGTNGFTCFVERTDYVRAQYRDDLLVPICFDPEGTRTVEPVSFDVARIRAAGKLSAQELKNLIVQRFADGVYRSPA